MFKWYTTIFTAFLFLSFSAFSTDRVSTGTANWNVAGSWSPSGVPVAGDNVTILSGHTISVNINTAVCSNLTINGTLGVNNNRTLSAGGNLQINNGGALNGSTGTLNVAGTFTVPASAAATIGSVILNVSGGSTISGALSLTNIGGSKTFAGVTVNSGGSWTATVAEAVTIVGTVSASGNFECLSGTYSVTAGFNTNAGTTNFEGSIGGALTVASSAIFNANTGNCTVTGTSTISGTVNITTTTGTKSFGSITVNSGGVWNSTVNETVTVAGNVATSGTWECFSSTYSVSGSFSVNGGTANYEGSIGAGLTVSSGALFNASTGILSVAGATATSGTLTISSATGTKTFADLTVNSGGTWNVTVSEIFAVSGSISCSGTFTSNTGAYTLSGAGKTISGTLSISSIAVTGTYTNNAILTVPTALTGAGTFTQGTGTLNMGATSGNFSVTTFNAATSGNTVNYNRAGVQNVRASSGGSYHHLTLAGTGNKSLVGATDINGDLTISSVLLSANFNMTIGGNWLNTGTFTAGTNTVTLDGAAQSITKSGGETFNHLVISGTGTKTLGSAVTTNGNLAINSTLDVSGSNFGVTVKRNWTNNGTFASRAGTVTFNGTVAQTLGGTSTSNFYNITQSNAAGVALARAQNLYNILTVSLGTFTTTGFTFTLISDVNGTASVAAIPAGANFAGNIVMQRYTGTGPTDWRFLSSAVSGATIADWADDFATSGFTGSTDPSNGYPSIYSYDETVLDVSDSGFVAATNVTNSISNGKGFWVYLGPNPTTFEVTGPPNTFTVTPSVTFTSNAGASHDGWNLIANPYPSAIDWDAASWTKTNIDNAVYVYNSSTGSYASYVAGVGVNGGSRYVASQQAFWVKANAASPVLRLVENVKTSQNPTHLIPAYNPNTSYYPMAFKDFPVPLNVNTTPNSIKLTANGNGLDDETLIYFTQGASSDFDGGFDAWKMQNLSPVSPNISSVINDTVDMSINSYPVLNTDVTIPIRITVPTAGIYSIRRDSLLILPLSSCVILEDLATGNFIDLRTNVSYSFTISDTTQAPRFLLHIYAPVSKEAVKTTCAGDSSGMAIAKGTGSGPWDYVWKDAGGNVLQTTPNSSASDTLMNLPVGVYTVEVSGSVCGTVHDTIQVKAASAIMLTLDHADVKCNGANNGSASVIVAGGISPYTYVWSNGDSTTAINGLSPGNYSVAVTDAGGCYQMQPFNISQPLVLLAGFNTSADTVDLSINNSVSFTSTAYGATSYWWDFGDSTEIDTSQNPIHYYSVSGTYSVTLIVSNGSCNDTAFALIHAIDSLNANGISDPDAGSGVSVVYDQDGAYLDFDLPQWTDVSISFYNVIGEKILRQDVGQIRKDRIRLGINGLSTGVYFSLISLENEVITRKIIIRNHHK